MPAINRLYNVQLRAGVASPNNLYAEPNSFQNKIVAYPVTKKINFNEKFRWKFPFNFNNQQHVLENINLKINKGEAVGIIGKTEVVKYFLDLILGIINPTKGKILVDGNDIDKN